MEVAINLIKKCEICDLNANCLCYQCISYFCDSCFKFIHDKQNNSTHKKELIDPFIPIETKCHQHPKIPINLFCVNEKGKIKIYNK